jgi:predicted enzyme related to lactoylglutathione lyase
MGLPVVHFEIECRDGQQARRFYSRLFDWNIQVMPNNPAEYGLVAEEDNGGGIGGAVCVVPQVPSTTYQGLSRDEGHAGQVTVFVQVPDVEEALAQAERLGGRRIQGPDPMGPGMQFGKLSDPEGHLIGVVSGAYAARRWRQRVADPDVAHEPARGLRSLERLAWPERAVVESAEGTEAEWAGTKRPSTCWRRS